MQGRPLNSSETCDRSRSFIDVLTGSGSFPINSRVRLVIRMVVFLGDIDTIDFCVSSLTGFTHGCMESSVRSIIMIQELLHPFDFVG
mmetsp:Transcript_18598/g.39090  ORF Transcript_18598/g.39090 Transcript_18598/m.39090 type:complete len:87 (+) Transcript_18598:539-799(+)